MHYPLWCTLFFKYTPQRPEEGSNIFKYALKGYAGYFRHLRRAQQIHLLMAGFHFKLCADSADEDDI